MRKSNTNQRLKVKSNLNMQSELSEDDTYNSEDKENQPEINPDYQNIYRCPKCIFIPLINVNDKENRVIIDCLQGHHKEIPFSEYMATDFQKNIYLSKCSNCGLDKNLKKIKKGCYECKKIFCKDCLSAHYKNNPNHHLNDIDKLDYFCPIHQSKYTYYCYDCKRNLCDECIKNETGEHKFTCFRNLLLTNKELNDLKNNLEKENNKLLEIRKIFNDTLTSLSNKFNNIISYKFLYLKFKNYIINTYKTKNTNYQIIDNIKHLKFINKDITIEQEMNELDIIYELFNFLDSIEYNDEKNNENNNENSNSINFNENEPNNYVNLDYVNNKENNKNYFDINNRIEERSCEDDNDNEYINENKNNESIKNFKKLKDESIKNKNEKNNEKENDNYNESELYQNNISKIGKDYIKKIDINNNLRKINDNDYFNMKKINSDYILRKLDNQISPTIINKNDFKNEDNEDNYNNLKENILINKIIKEDKNEETNFKEVNNREDNYDNKNNTNKKEYNNIYNYKLNNQIPVINEYDQKNIQENHENSINNNIDVSFKGREQKKKIKKSIKKKKLKQIIKPNDQNALEGSDPYKTKKNNLIDNNKINDELIIQKEEKKEQKKNNIINNIFLENNETDFQTISNNSNVEKNLNELRKIINENMRIKENEKEQNYTINNLNEEELKNNNILNDNINKKRYMSSENLIQDNISNDLTGEEVPNTNHEEYKENKIAKKNKKIKKKKKKLSIIKIDNNTNKNNEIDNIENNKSINRLKKESSSYNIFKTKKGKYHCDLNKDNNDLPLFQNNEICKNNIYNNEDNKSKTLYKENNNSAFFKRIYVTNSKEENEKKSNNINNDERNMDNSNNNINKLNNILNLNSNEEGKINRFKKNQIIKRKKIKKKKYLISLDSKGNVSPAPEKKMKIIKKITLIRSKSKDRLRDRRIPQEIFNSILSNNLIEKNKDKNFETFINEDNNSSNNNTNSSHKSKKNANNIRKINRIDKDLINNIKIKNNKRKIKMAQGKNKVAIFLENKEEVYLAEKNIKKMKKHKNRREKDNNKERFLNINRSVDDFKKRSNKGLKMNYEYNFDEINYLIERSNSYKIVKRYKKFSEREKINCIKFENGVSCILEINSEILALGNLIGDIIIINYHTYKQIQTIREHEGTIISLTLLHDKSILSCSADRKMIKIRLKENETQYDVEFIFDGYENYILKAIELTNTFKIITCSWDDILFVWEKVNDINYQNTIRFNEGERVIDLLEINANYFVSVSENNELKLWNSYTFEMIDSIKNIKCICTPNALCKINDIILAVLDYHEIQLIDVTQSKLVNKITVDDGNLSCIIKLNDNSILVAEDYNSDKYCIFYLKQFYYEQKDLKPISYKRDKFYKSNNMNDKEIRALVQFSNGVIVQGISGEYKGKDSGDLIFYY